MPETRRRRPTRRRVSQMYQRVNRKAIHGAECSEDEHQEALFSWIDDTEALQTDPIKRDALHFLHHIPNGKSRGSRIVVQRRGVNISLPPPDAFRLKTMGLRRGIFDLRLDYMVITTPPAIGKTGSPTPFTVCSGLIIEMKSDAGSLAPEQVHYQRYMASQHVICRVCRTWQGAARAIAGYMQLEKIAPVFVKGDDRYVMTITDPAILQGLEAIKE